MAALLLRETRTRFGKHQLGYLWAFVEPILWVGMFIGIRLLTGWHAAPGMDLVSFVVTGIIPFLIFRRTVSSGASGIAANRGLLFYPQVRPLDLIIARSLLEVATLTLVFAVLMVANGIRLEALRVDSVFVTWCGLMSAGLLGSVLGMVFCGLTTFSATIERIQGTLMRPLFWTSGLFFTANELPSGVREVMLYNPVLHAVEMVRDGWFAAYTARYVSVSYLLYWIVGLAFLGLTLERVARRRIQFT